MGIYNSYFLIEKLKPSIYFTQEKPHDLGEIADKYLNETPGKSHDETFGMRKIEGLYYIGNNQATIFNNNILIDDEKFEGTPGLWELLMLRHPQGFTKEDYDNYA